MAWIDGNLLEHIKRNFPGRKTKGYYEYHTWQTSRYIYVTTVLDDDENIHYEYFQDHVELHLEGKYQSEDYRRFVRELRQKTYANPKLNWLSWQGHSQYRCRIEGQVNTADELVGTFKAIMEIFDPIIENAAKTLISTPVLDAYDGPKTFTEAGLEYDEVSLETCCLGQVFSNQLIVPNYQRKYCWEDKHVKNLWSSLQDVTKKGYHLGTIILQKTPEGKYAIIDGQQRLVTLTIILSTLGYNGDLPLLQQSFNSEKSKLQIANNKWLIKILCSQLHDDLFCQKILKHLLFSVLILKENQLNLAYTFFSNQNSKGVELTDFDLLKAHHLRYIPYEKQQEHMVGRWNTLIERKYGLLDKTLSTHLFRLRKWMRKRDYDVTEAHRVKEEFSAADFVPNIPPFGERFDFYEKIQGGTHFFAYAETFVEKYEDFSKTTQVSALRNHLSSESHWKYADVIETLLFGYYLKFGTQYLSEALSCITANIAQHRYTSSRAFYYKIREFAKNSEIIMMIDQASSPTFFLKECSSAVRVHGRDVDEGISLRFYKRVQDMEEELFHGYNMDFNE